MGNLIRLPAPTSRVCERARLWGEEPRATGLIGLLPRRMTRSVRTAATAMRFGSPLRLKWHSDDRHLIAATNALLADRSPRGVHLSLDDAKALSVAIALRTLHPGGGAPTPNYVDGLARQVRTVQRRIRGDPLPLGLYEANGRGSSYRSDHVQQRDQTGS